MQVWPIASLAECRVLYENPRGSVTRVSESNDTSRSVLGESKDFPQKSLVRESSGISELSRIKARNCESWLCPLSPSSIPGSPKTP